MSRSTSRHIEPILKAAQQWRDDCLLGGGSVFSENEVWSNDLLEEFRKHFVENLDEGKGSFFEKLKAQLSHGSAGLQHLAAEIMWLYFLFPARINTATKISRVAEIWSWSGENLKANHPMLDVFENGIGYAGPAFVNHRWRELVYLHGWVENFRSRPKDEQRKLVGDPWNFANWLDQERESDRRQFRHILLYLLFPESFEPMASLKHKRWIVKAWPKFSESAELEGSESELATLDKRILAVRTRLESENHRVDFDFYQEPWRSQWDQDFQTPEDATATTSNLAPPFDEIFGDLNSARQFFDIARFTCESLGIAGDIGKDPRFSVTVPKYAGRATFRANFGNWVLFSCVRKNGDAPVFEFASHPDFLPVGISPMYEGDGFKDNAGERTFSLYGIPVSETEKTRFREETIAPSMEVIAEHFADWKASPFRQYHRPELLQMIFYSDLREKLLAEGLPEGPKPPVVKEEEALEEYQPYGRNDFLADAFFEASDYDELSSLLRRKKALILQGPPGVGKSFLARRLAYSMIGRKDPSKVGMVQFHQSYAYEDFIQGYRPAGGDGQMRFELRNGAFHQFCEQARSDPSSDHFFIIDEINRGNLSRIFGEVMLLLEADKRDPSFAVSLTYSPGQPFFIPPNVYLIGLMNTADRSLAMVDYALRRRFAFTTLRPQFDSGKFHAHLQGKGLKPDFVKRLAARMTELNTGIAEDTRDLGHGFCIGHSYFTPLEPVTRSDQWFTEIVQCEIKPLLEEYWADSPDRAKSEVSKLLDG